MKILITGNLGYIGPVVVKRLRQVLPNAILIGLDTGFFQDCLSVNNCDEDYFPHYQYYGDVRNVNLDFLTDVDAIIHLAAISNDPMGNQFQDSTMDINFNGTVNLAQLAKEAKVKSFVFASSCSMYGNAALNAKTESDELNPLTVYAKSKVLSEQELESLADSNFFVTALRFSTAAGWSCRLRLDLVLNDFVSSALLNKEITILSNGKPWRPIIDVKDMARAIEWGITRTPNLGGNFLAVNIGSNDANYKIKDLAELVAQVIPDTKVSINPNALDDNRSYKVNFDLFKKLAPYHQPQIKLINTINELKTGIEQMQFQTKNIYNTKYIRLNILNELIKKRKLNRDLSWINYEYVNSLERNLYNFAKNAAKS